MKLKKIFHIAKPIYTQTPIFTISDEVLLQYLEYTQKSEEVGNESGLTKINLTEKKQSRLSEEKISFFHERKGYYYFLEEKYENEKPIASIKRRDNCTKALISSVLMPELCGSLDGNQRLHVMGDLFYLNNYTEFYIFNFSLECIYKYKTWRSLDSVVYWDNQIIYSTESDGCQNSVLMKHILTEKRYEEYPIDTFFPKKYKGNALNCFKTAKEYLLIEVDSYPRQMVILNKQGEIIFRADKYIEKVYFAHPERKEVLFFRINQESGTGIYQYKNWETDEIIWECLLTEDFDVNWYDRYPIFWKQKDKFIFNGFQKGKKGFWVIDVQTSAKEFFKPIGDFGANTLGSILFKESYAIINTISTGNLNYYYKLE